MTGDRNVIVLLNKSDLSAVVGEEELNRLFEDLVPQGGQKRIIKTSTREGAGMDEFEKTVKDMFFHGELKTSTETVITSLRHREALEEAMHSLELVGRSAEADMPEDFYSIDLMSSYSALGRIIGEEVDDDLVEEIFSKFCMGK
jgi:tRNA modification GTPase